MAVSSIKSVIRDISLHETGQLKIDWVREHMPVLNTIREQIRKDKPFSGKRIAICIHLEAKTAFLALVLKEGGAEVSVTGSNPLSTQDDVAAALVKNGVDVFAWHGSTMEEYFSHLDQTLDTEPNLILDDGGDLTALLHTKRRELLGKIIGGCEETTTGIIRMKSLEREGKLEFPMIAVNNALSKYLFDNRYGTGQSVWDGIMRTTNLVVAGKTVVVIGYGWCGKGVSMRAKGLGAKVVICEVDPIKANEALMDGFEVMTMDEASAHGDVFITVTGCKDVIIERHFKKMKDGAILANAGHFDVEISKGDLDKVSQRKRKVRPNIEEFLTKDSRRLYLLAEGRLVNLAAGDGHPAEIMDMSFALQTLSLRYLAEKGKELDKRVYSVPKEIDEEVARLRLKSLGISIDSLTPEQQRYLESWIE